MKLSGISQVLYMLARKSRDVKAVASGSPKKLVKRGVNKTIGRKVVKKLWR